MTPAARIQASIEILDLVIEAATSGGAPADRLIAEWFRAHRFAGSKDKRAIREHVYDAIRACGPVPPSGRAAMLRLAATQPDLRDLFDGSQYGPAGIAPDEQVADGGVAPTWLVEKLAQSEIVGEEAEALLDRAPLDLRINTLRADPEAVDLPLAGEPAPAPGALRFPAGTPVEQWDAWEQGLIEVQDAGSQLACAAVAAQPGETVIDLCAGAGGKTLALAAAMQNEGTLIASDTDRGRLSRLAPRAGRAGATIAEARLLNPGREGEVLGDLVGKADAVLVDAPCSGTGTWRRNPEARWRLSDKQLAQYTQVQARLLGMASMLVRPGGRLVYVTCSLLDEEGAAQLDAFLSRLEGWNADDISALGGEPRGQGIRLNPYRHGTDGFFIARLSRL
ncbi:MAG: RsmB/NOP family class I SAM-dependent RNA methyltransferase [Sphingomonadaceae bacterium]